jgi:Uma2 family endonuclease
MLPCVVEVVSPSTSHHDRFEKRRVYQEQGVATYWIVDTAHRNVEVWTPDAHFPVIERETVRWFPAGASAPLVIALDWLFGD